MGTVFDSEAIEKLGWRQGAILDENMGALAGEHAPKRVVLEQSDYLIITTHDCDVLNAALEKEPVVEILRARVTSDTVNKLLQAGRNPRTLQLNGQGHSLTCVVHDRWTMPRELLAGEAPRAFLDDKQKRLLSEWLAKRYIRSAFPSAFDRRWRRKLGAWQKLLAKHSNCLQGVYMQLNTLAELGDDTTYTCNILLAVPASKRMGEDWPNKRAQLEEQVEEFWLQFDGIDCEEVDVQGTDEIVLERLSVYQRFDADWVSFTDGSETTATISDMQL